MKNKMIILSHHLLQVMEAPKQQRKIVPSSNTVLDISKIDCVPSGERNSTLLSMMGSYSRQGFSKESAYEYAHHLNQTHFDPPLCEQEVDSVVNSVYRYNNYNGQRSTCSKVYALTDVGNAQRFADMFGHIVRYVPEQKSFYIYDGKRWLQSTKGEIERMARSICKSMKEEAIALQDSDQRKALIKYANKSESEQRIKAMINLLKSEENIVLSINDFDKNPMLFNCNNGTVNLKTKELQPHNNLDFITELAHIDYDLEAKAPQFIKFLNITFKNNQTMITYLKQVIGYTLTGSTIEQCFFILQGIGSNGKSVLIDVLKSLLGSYSCNAEFRTFTKQASSTVRNDLARMAKARIVTAVEGDKKSSLDESIIKSITGGDTVTARFLYKEFFDYLPPFKIFLVTNFLPKISNSGHSIWRRIKIIPFDVIIPNEEQDKDLTNKLKSELSGILNWAIEGCMEWQKDSFKEPLEVTNAVNKYRCSVDSANIFIQKCCELDNVSTVLFGDIYDEYGDWCDENLYDIIPNKEFAHVLLENGCVSYRGFPGGDRGYKGIKVKGWS